MARICKIVLVCEGVWDECFARGFLAAANINPRCIDCPRNPGGSGHDWVKTTFVEEVANLTRFSEGRGVLGLLDEDGQGAEARQRGIEDELRVQELGSVAAREGRCLLLPARNLETWLYWLRGLRNQTPVDVNEEDNYKVSPPPLAGSKISYGECKPAGEFLHSLNHTQLPPGCPSALARALGQLREFLEAVRR